MGAGVLRMLGLPLLLAAAGAWGQNRGLEAEQKAAFEAADRVKVVGPASVALRDQASLQLPLGQVFIPVPAAERVMRAMGSAADPRLVGIVLPVADEPWVVAVKFIPDGHVRTDDARDWQPDALLQALREGTEAANPERVRRGLPAIELVGWAEPPRYDAASHRLAWAASAREKGSRVVRLRGVNHNTYVLGREGYISLNLLTDLERLAQFKPVARELVEGLRYRPGKAYGDFDASLDPQAPYALGTLVAGVPAAPDWRGLQPDLLQAHGPGLALIAYGLLGLAALARRRRAVGAAEAGTQRLPETKKRPSAASVKALGPRLRGGDDKRGRGGDARTASRG